MCREPKDRDSTDCVCVFSDSDILKKFADFRKLEGGSSGSDI